MPPKIARPGFSSMKMVTSPAAVSALKCSPSAINTPCRATPLRKQSSRTPRFPFPSKTLSATWPSSRPSSVPPSPASGKSRQPESWSVLRSCLREDLLHNPRVLLDLILAPRKYSHVDSVIRLDAGKRSAKGRLYAFVRNSACRQDLEREARLRRLPDYLVHPRRVALDIDIARHLRQFTA